MTSLTAGDILYKYELKSHLGGGCFGDVWLAHDRSISKDIAVKILSSNASIDERLQEARIGNRMEHPNLVKVHYADIIQHQAENIVIIAMDYLEKGAITNKVNAMNFLPIPLAIKFIIDILRGLEYLHEYNLYHSDIKPQNILVGDQNEGILTDYGISCHSPQGCSTPHRGFYKLHAAPEVISSGEMSVQTDIYQVGLTAFRLINGLGTIRDKFLKVGEDGFNTLVDQGKIVLSHDYHLFVPRNLKTIINKSINIDPSKRYQSALQFRRSLEHLIYPGYWTCDSSGKLVGNNSTYEFTFHITPKNSNLFDLIAYKTNKISGRKTKISMFSQNNITKLQLDGSLQTFFQWVTIGT